MKSLFNRVYRFRRRILLISPLVVVAAAALGYVLMHQAKTPVVVNRVKHQTKAVQGTETPPTLVGQWDYIPGTVREGKVLRVLPAGFAIVNQDGSGGQANPGINLFGTHYAVSGDFSVTATLSDIKGAAAVQFYGEVPVIADEFRVERKSVRATIDGTNLSVNLWNGRSQKPSLTKVVPHKPIVGPIALTMSRQGTSLVFSLDGVALVTVSDSAVFSSGEVWIGMHADSDSWLLTDIKAGGLGAGKLTAIDTTTLKAIADPQGLQTLANSKRPGLKIGAAMALGPAVADTLYANVAFGGNFGILTTENALKWQFVHPQPGIYSFQEGDALVALAQNHGMQVHGHTLVFGEANPRWVRNTPPAQLEGVMVDHIKNVVGHYKGKMVTWDVINEPFDDEEWDQFRPNIWYKAMGESYIPKALIAAHEADPNAKLFINEYGIEEDGDRWNAMLALVTKLKKQGVPIHGVGFQSHVYAPGDEISASVLRKHFRQLAALGLEARVSEMDVYSEGGQSLQATQYSQVFGACLAEANCISFTSWGVTDRYDYFKDDDGSIQTGEDFLWDRSLKPTPAVAAIRSLLR